jgi:PAS domain S-box-containing protein
MSGLHLESVEALLNAHRRERWLELGIGLFAVLLALALWQAVRIRREKVRTLCAERAQRGTEQKLRLMANNLTEMVLAYDMNRRLIYANPAVETLTGYSAAELELEKVAPIDWVHPDDRVRMMAHWGNLFEGKSVSEEEYRLVTKDGTVKWAASTWGPILDEAGRQVGVQGSEHDITERKAAEEALRESERRFRGLLEDIQWAAVITNLRGYTMFCNQYFLTATGWERDEFIGHRVTDFLVPEDRARVSGILQNFSKDTPSHWTTEPGVLTKNGKVRWLQATNLVLRDAQGNPVAVATVGADITEHRALQEQYLHAQKMEGLGRLAGGVAHDFNNLLTVINGYSDIVFQKLQEGDPLRSNLDQVRKAGARAVDLTQQLLAFSRRQMIQPKPMDLNLVVADSETMWKRLLGENIHLVTSLNPALGPVMADAGQIHQVLMNLVVNARDAMPDGGKLTIETSNADIDPVYAAANSEAVAGPYILLAVSDTGAGMDEETRKRIFEPFFTTKPPGAGSGLGLATVYGIVKQNHGWISVSSEPGKGTAFKIYLPRLESKPSRAEAPVPMRAGKPCSETILLVEDQDDVRRLAKTVLEECGYRVLASSSGPKALALVESHPGPIHLLLTDVVLPGMNGRELAERLTAARPGIRVLFTSGYTHEAAALRTVLDRGLAFLPKPYAPHAMAAKVREVIDGPAPV